jgi:hypothetical protein
MRGKLFLTLSGMVVLEKASPESRGEKTIERK